MSHAPADTHKRLTPEVPAAMYLPDSQQRGIAILRNPQGVSDAQVRHSQQWAAERIETLQAERDMLDASLTATAAMLNATMAALNNAGAQMQAMVERFKQLQADPRFAEIVRSTTNG